MLIHIHLYICMYFLLCSTLNNIKFFIEQNKKIISHSGLKLMLVECCFRKIPTD